MDSVLIEVRAGEGGADARALVTEYLVVLGKAAALDRL